MNQEKVHENYFEGIHNENDAKARYKELAKKFHPDLGGCVEKMKIINLQYEKVLSGVYQKAGKSITEIEELLKKSQRLAEKIYEIINCVGIVVEICGNWIWITGDTKLVKDTLKEAGFFWASKKLAWYWRAEESASKHRGKVLSLDQIREKHGREILNNFGLRVQIS